MMSVALTQAEKIENAIDKNRASALTVTRNGGGMVFQNMGEILEFAKLMAISQQAVPKHCRNNPGVCLGITLYAEEWGMSPYAVAAKSYIVNDQIAFESQLVHAVIERRAPTTGRLRHEFIGEGERRQCKVWATAKGETEPLIFVSSEFGKIQPKNSPLWKTKPDLQLYYNASRDWARMYFPDVIMGVYAEDEFEALSVTLNPPTIDKPRTLGQLTDQLKAKQSGANGAGAQQPETPAAEGPQLDQSDADDPGPEDVNQDAEPSELEACRAEIFAAPDKTTLKKLLDTWTGPESTLDEPGRQQVLAWCAERDAQISASRGAGSNK